jgi:N-acetyl-gamma-glutamyl-phosphate reductase
VSGHRHTPETSAQLQRFTDQKVGLIFTPHLVPMIRGMHATLYARLTQDIDNAALQALFEDQYKDAEFVDVMPFGSHPETRSTRGSNMLRLALHRPERQHRRHPGGAGQPGQGRLGPGRAVHEPDVRLAGNTGLKQIALLP